VEMNINIYSKFEHTCCKDQGIVTQKVTHYDSTINIALGIIIIIIYPIIIVIGAE